jgi:cytochrome c-type biogenesis protein CcmE
VDLTPREVPGSSPKAKKRWLPMLIVVGAVVAGGVVVTQFLTSAIDYYCNVDEVGAKSGCEGDRRMRVQGIVEKGTFERSATGSAFVIEFNGKKINITYAGDPGGVFQECISVVAHGRVVNGTFESDRIEVKHSNEYVEKNDDRISSSDEESAACSLQEA